MASEQNNHLSAEAIQAFLEGEAPERVADDFRDHVASCARCRAEVEAFQLLFAELGALPELAPTKHFADRVMAELPSRLSTKLSPEREPLAVRTREWLRAHLPGSTASGHPSSERLQDFVEGLMPARKRNGVRAHVGACAACASEVEEWSHLFGSLETLPELAPSDGFGERVMARVRIPQTVAERAPERTREWPILAGARSAAARLRPRSRRGWAVAGGIAMAPGVAFAAISYMILSHPLLTFGYLAAFLWWQVTGAISSLAGGIAGRVAESVTAFQAYSTVEAVLASPAAAVTGAITLSGLMAAALWILYRNLIQSPMAAGHDARSAN